MLNISNSAQRFSKNWQLLGKHGEFSNFSLNNPISEDYRRRIRQVVLSMFYGTAFLKFGSLSFYLLIQSMLVMSLSLSIFAYNLPKELNRLSRMQLQRVSISRSWTRRICRGFNNDVYGDLCLQGKVTRPSKRLKMKIHPPCVQIFFSSRVVSAKTVFMQIIGWTERLIRSLRVERMALKGESIVLRFRTILASSVSIL